MENLKSQSKQQGNQAGIFVPDLCTQLEEAKGGTITYEDIIEINDFKLLATNAYMSVSGNIKSDSEKIFSVIECNVTDLNIKSIELHAYFSISHHDLAPHDFTLVAYFDKDHNYLGHQITGLPNSAGVAVFTLNPPEEACFLRLSCSRDHSTQVFLEITALYAVNIADSAKKAAVHDKLVPKAQMRLVFTSETDFYIDAPSPIEQVRTRFAFTKKSALFPNLQIVENKVGHLNLYRQLCDIGPSIMNFSNGPVLNTYSTLLVATREGLEYLHGESTITSNEGYVFSIYSLDSSKVRLVPAFSESPEKQWKAYDYVSFSGISDSLVTVEDHNLSTAQSRTVKINEDYTIENPKLFIGQECYECKVIENCLIYNPAYIDWSLEELSLETLPLSSPAIFGRIVTSYTFTGNSCFANTLLFLNPGVFADNMYMAGINARVKETPWATSNHTIKIPKLAFSDFYKGVFWRKLPAFQQIYRNETFLSDLNDSPDRLMLRGQTTQPSSSSIGISEAAIAMGCSLISGSTAKDKKLSNLPPENSDFSIGQVGKRTAGKDSVAEYRLASICATSQEGSKVKTGIPIELNYYVSFFDASIDKYKTQLYWYKENDTHVIYYHSSGAAGNGSISGLPLSTEGLGVEVVETKGIELISNRIIGSTLAIMRTEQETYIVLKTI